MMPPLVSYRCCDEVVKSGLLPDQDIIVECIALNCNYTTALATLSINDIAFDADFNIYPNPTYNSATIDLSQFNGKEVTIELYDALGRQSKNITNIKTDKYVLQRDNLQSGIYFMNVLVDGKRFSKKIIFE